MAELGEHRRPGTHAASGVFLRPPRMRLLSPARDGFAGHAGDCDHDFRPDCMKIGTALARIFHSLSHRYDHLPASGSSDGGSQGICGLDSKPPLRGEIM